MDMHLHSPPQGGETKGSLCLRVHNAVAAKPGPRAALEAHHLRLRSGASKLHLQGRGVEGVVLRENPLLCQDVVRALGGRQQGQVLGAQVAQDPCCDIFGWALCRVLTPGLLQHDKKYRYISK